MTYLEVSLELVRLCLSDEGEAEDGKKGEDRARAEHFGGVV